MPIEQEKMIDLLLDVQRSIGRLEGKLDSHIMTSANHMATNAENVGRITKKDEDQDKAIRSLEINQGRWAGVAAFMAAMGSWLSYHFWPFHI